MNSWLKQIVEKSTIDSDHKILMICSYPGRTWRQFPWDKVVWWMFDLRVPFGTILFLVHCRHFCLQLFELYCNHFSGIMSCTCFMCSYVLTQQNRKCSCCSCQQCKSSETSIGLFLEPTVFNTGKHKKNMQVWSLILLWEFLPEILSCSECFRTQLVALSVCALFGL